MAARLAGAAQACQKKSSREGDRERALPELTTDISVGDQTCPRFHRNQLRCAKLNAPQKRRPCGTGREQASRDMILENRQPWNFPWRHCIHHGKNHLLAHLPRPDLECIASDLELVEMPLGELPYESGGQLHHVYFPTTPIVSLLYVMKDGASAEMAAGAIRYGRAHITVLDRNGWSKRCASIMPWSSRKAIAFLLPSGIHTA